ncbi:MAG TPA: acyl carrier protein [Succinivibrionaceae bacterium]|nr:acyl carrier protein [Succinivibrionaceae bacterium]
MEKTEIYSKLSDIFRLVFDDDSITIDEHTSRSSIPSWDSLEHVNLLMAIENKFNIRFDIEEAAEIQNVSQIVEYIVKNQ